MEEEAAVIRNMARWFLDGDSLERIKHRLEDAGIETTTGKKTWSTGTIYNILTNEKSWEMCCYKRRSRQTT